MLDKILDWGLKLIMLMVEVLVIIGLCFVFSQIVQEWIPQ